jgi:ubiquinone/menaquinone biosynthesis C-methylase UbiE
MYDPQVVFSVLALKEGDSFLDIGCGPGDFAVHAAGIVGESGVVYALDRQEDMIDTLKYKADSRGLKNIRAIVADVSTTLPVEDDCIEVCLLATVLHALGPAADRDRLFEEMRRVLRPDGRVAVVECKKEDTPFGPPLHMRISPREMEDSITGFGFEKRGCIDLGNFYLIEFGVTRDMQG